MSGRDRAHAQHCHARDIVRRRGACEGSDSIPRPPLAPPSEKAFPSFLHGSSAFWSLHTDRAAGDSVHSRSLRLHRSTTPRPDSCTRIEPFVPRYPGAPFFRSTSHTFSALRKENVPKANGH